MASILVVDDDACSRTYLVALLNRAGYRVQEACSGLEGLEQVARGAIDLIITDIFMPTMDGLELLAVLDKLHPTNKVIAMSGGGLAMDRKLALHAAHKFGAVALIRKPFNVREVIRTVATALQGVA
ncbi:MAG: response regulator [Magnetococcales bacterium]|nr:response regulator [Magnetococcales bacterium]